MPGNFFFINRSVMWSSSSCVHIFVVTYANCYFICFFSLQTSLEIMVFCYCYVPNIVLAKCELEWDDETSFNLFFFLFWCAWNTVFQSVLQSVFFMFYRFFAYFYQFLSSLKILTWPTQPSATCHARLMCKFLSFKSMTFCLVLSSPLCPFLEAEDSIHFKKLKLLARNGDSCENAHENLLIPVKMLTEIC